MENVFESVFGGIQAFVYRCRNDRDYTMDFMTGGIQSIAGYAPHDVLNNARISYVNMTAEADKEHVFAEVDKAIEEGVSWDVAYRLTHLQGHLVWVRERGSAVYENGELAYLQGLVVNAEAEFAIHTQLEQQVQDTKSVTGEIVDLTQQITRSVRELTMLSVNARIEAARSGPAGQGFAVVANEMKTLADRNAGLAGQIADHVQLMNGPEA